MLRLAILKMPRVVLARFASLLSPGTIVVKPLIGRLADYRRDLERWFDFVKLTHQYFLGAPQPAEAVA